MCGIAGLLEFTDKTPSKTILDYMASRLRHRGPDGQGIKIDGPCGMVHTRLAILDPQRGTQPLASVDGRVWITYNGEIYNSPHLRKHLKSKGYNFKTTTDTEVIVNLYHYDPAHFVEKLEGIFAFAIWDSRDRKLVLARDYLGVKPLYIYQSDDVLVFGSEVKALLVDHRVTCEIDPVGLMEILAFQNTYPRRTCFKDIQLLDAGVILTVWQSGTKQSRRYWSFPIPIVNCDYSFEEGTRRLRALLQTVVSDQLLSDVPVACYLSGGMDTGAITALASQSLQSFHTFSGGFLLDGVPQELHGFDEREASELMSRNFGTHHHFREIRPEDLIESFTSISWYLEEPRGSTCYAPWVMAKEAGARVKVIMSGHGGDELFAGYRDRYELARSYGHKWDEYWFSILNFVVPQAKMAHWLHPDFVSKELLDWPKQAFCEFIYPTRDMSPQARAQHHDLFVYMHGLLLIEDKLSMAHGLESRVPLLDRRIFEFAWTLPDNWKLSASQGKAILRKSLRGLLPDSILQREKMGFGPPDEHYYRTNLAGFLEMLLLDGSLASRNIIKPNVIKRLVERQRAGNPLGGTLWALASIELWYRTFIDRVSQLRCNDTEFLQGPIELFFTEERARISILGNAESVDMSCEGKPVQAAARFHQKVGCNIRRKLGSLRELGSRMRASIRHVILGNIRRKLGSLRVLASRIRTNIRHVILPPTFSIYSKKWLARISGRLALDLRTKLERHLLSTQSPEPHKEIRIFQGLYATVQPTFLRKAWQEGGMECCYETLVWNPNYEAPDLYHNNIHHPDVYYEQVEFWRDVLLPRPFTFIDDHTLHSLWNLLEERWSKYNVFHFDWFLSFLPDNADVEFLRRSGRAVYFHFRGCFILSRKITDQFTKRGKGIQEACAYCQEMGWREEYFARFHKGISNASRVFVSTPNLCHCSSDFEYVPLSLDPTMESLPPLERPGDNSSPVIVLHCVGSPGHYAVKGTEHIRRAVQELAEEGFDVKLKTIEDTTRQKAVVAMKGGDIMVEQLNLGSYGNVAVEAMAYGLPVISSLHPSIKHLVPGCPIVHADPTTLVIRLRELLTDSLMRQEIGKRSYEFVRKFHSNKLVASYLSRIYNADLGMAPTEGRNTIANMNPSYE